MILISLDIGVRRHISIPLKKFLGPIPSIGGLYFGGHHLILITPEIIKTLPDFRLLIETIVIIPTKIPNLPNINAIQIHLILNNKVLFEIKCIIDQIVIYADKGKQ
jgi:hypothetical protein